MVGGPRGRVTRPACRHRADCHWMECDVEAQVLPSDHARLVTGGGRELPGAADGRTIERTVRDAGKRVGNHPGQGQTAFIFALLLAGACIALYVYDACGERLRSRLGISDRYRLPIDENVVLYAIGVPVAPMALATMILAGHSGATLVWKTAGSVTPTPGP